MAQQLKLLDQVRRAVRLKGYSYRTEQAYVQWSKRYILYHNKRHPAEMGKADVEDFLAHLAMDRNVAASTQNQALSALLFLYRVVLDQPVEWVDMAWSKKPERLPVVLTQGEVKAVMAQLSGVPSLVVRLLYGGGLRVREGIGLRVQDVDFGQRLLVIRDGKGNKDRTTTLPDVVVPALQAHLEKIRALHYRDLEAGNGRAPLPDALAKKYVNAETRWVWQFVFPSARLSRNPRGDDTLYRFHIHESTIQKAVRKAAVRADVKKRVTPHVFRHSFATHLLERGVDIRTIQELMGHKHVKTTMIYTHVVNQGVMGVRSPLDEL
jgi:integron integrase